MSKITNGSFVANSKDNCIHFGAAGTFNNNFRDGNYLQAAAARANKLIKSAPHVAHGDELEWQRLKDGFTGGIYAATNGCKPLYNIQKPFYYNWTACDIEVTEAKALNMHFKYHTLFWYNQCPEWYTNANHELVKNFGKDDWKNLTKDIIYKTIEHYGSQVRYYDLINEMWLSKQKNIPLAFISQIGEGNTYREQALDFAIFVFENANAAAKKYIKEEKDRPKFGINEWNTGLGLTKHNNHNFLYIVRELHKRNLIDYVGHQMHIRASDLNTKQKIGEIERTLNEYNRLGGVSIHFSEVDIKGTGSNYTELGRKYKELYDICYKFQSCNVFMTWGVSDRFSWLSDQKRSKFGSVLLYDASRNLKSAGKDLLKHMKNLASKRCFTGEIHNLYEAKNISDCDEAGSHKFLSDTSIVKVRTIEQCAKACDVDKECSAFKLNYRSGSCLRYKFCKRFAIQNLIHSEPVNHIVPHDGPKVLYVKKRLYLNKSCDALIETYIGETCSSTAPIYTSESSTRMNQAQCMDLCLKYPHCYLFELTIDNAIIEPLKYRCRLYSAGACEVKSTNPLSSLYEILKIGDVEMHQLKSQNYHTDAKILVMVLISVIIISSVITAWIKATRNSQQQMHKIKNFESNKAEYSLVGAGAQESFSF